MFKVKTNLKPKGDQPKAIAQLTKNLKAGVKHQVLLGVTGSGKTATMAWTIEKVQKPTLVISPNKTLAAQLYQEFKEFFPDNAVHYFVSYYDYYQPEAYIPQTDTYIQKDAKINQTIDRLRHAAVQDLLQRNDVIIVASVSCIYNIGSPEDYANISIEIKKEQDIKRRELFELLASAQYERNDYEVNPGIFKVRGEVVEVYPATGRQIIRFYIAGNKIEEIEIVENPFTKNEKTYYVEKIKIFPAKFWVTPQDRIKIAVENIKLELKERVKELKKQGKFLEAERLQKRTMYDIEMLLETGYCHGVENYSRHLEFREPGSPPFTLLHYYPKDFLMFIDESHQTIPQIKAMAVQDRKRKEPLVEYGFRLPSCFDNRPLTYEEFENMINQVIYVSATPDEFEIKKSKPYIVEQIVRPTGLLEPEIEIRPTKDQIKDAIKEIEKRVKKNQRILVLTLTKRMAEAVSEYLQEKQISSSWLHSEVKTLKRPEIIKNLREGKYDVLVGVNLLREGIDLPEVSLVLILDADKEGFLRSETTLLQMMGRAARHIEGKVILYADKITKSMEKAIKEVERRRKIQMEYNKKHNIKPHQVVKPIREFITPEKAPELVEFELIDDIKLLEKEMQEAVKNLDFERAIIIRDKIKELKKAEK